MAKAIFQDPIFHNEDLARRPYQGNAQRRLGFSPLEGGDQLS
jgi:hypothetical protein